MRPNTGSLLLVTVKVRTRVNVGDHISQEHFDWQNHLVVFRFPVADTQANWPSHGFGAHVLIVQTHIPCRGEHPDPCVIKHGHPLSVHVRARLISLIDEDEILVPLSVMQGTCGVAHDPSSLDLLTTANDTNARESHAERREESLV